MTATSRPTDRPVEDEVAVVTGSASGIGLATLRLAAERGWRVVGIDIARHRPDTRIAGESGGCVVEADVGDPDEMAAAIDEAAARGAIGIAVSSAGVLREEPFAHISDTTLSRTLRTHAGGLFNLVQACLPHLRAHGEGSVVAIASELVDVGATDHAHYVAAKAAIVGVVRAAARELATDGVRVNAVAPGPVDTPLLGPSGRDVGYLASLPLGRLGQPEEIARAVMDVAVWSWTTGAIVSVDGGAVIRG